MIFPTSFSPKLEIELDDKILLRPYKRVSIKELSQTGYYNSIEVINNNPSIPNTCDDYIRFILFHSFVFDENVGIEYFEEISSINLQYPEFDTAEPTDFDNIISELYLIDPSSIPKDISVSYKEMYQIFKKLNLQDMSLIKNYVTDFLHNPSSPDRQIVNTAYWQIMVYYSIIENILTRQPFCSGTHECPKCGRSNICHCPESEAKWLTKRINKIVKSPKQASEYDLLVSSVRTIIRHNTVHNSEYPTAQYIVNEADRVEYDITKSFGDLSSDQTALTSIVYSVRHLAKFLLLNKFFGLDIFPRIPPLIVVRVDLNSKS